MTRTGNSPIGTFIGQLGGPIGSLLGSLGGKLIGSVVGKLFGAEGKATKKMRAGFLEQAGGIEEVRKRAEYAGVSIDKINEYEPVLDGGEEHAGQMVGALPERD